MKKNRGRKSLFNNRSPQNGDLFLQRPGPVALGTGLIALDIVVTDRHRVGPRCWAGGTCGNVMAILSYLGWRTYPAAMLGADAAANRVIEDLERFGVNSQFLRRSSTRKTPIVVERIRTRGLLLPKHRFVWTCPNCGAWLPGYHALLAKEAREMAQTMPEPVVFFFDRVSRGALDLAQASAKHGALVIFEPSGIGDERLFREAIALSHIVKYSHERLGHLREEFKYRAPILEIETMGANGLRYRLKGIARWREMAAYSVQHLRDSAGAGDWCTAGLLHAIAAGGSKGLESVKEEDVEAALRLGQALAALKCRYDGARGPMYALSKKSIASAVKGMLSGVIPVCSEDKGDDQKLGKIVKAFCPSCDTRIRSRPRTSTPTRRVAVRG